MLLRVSMTRIVAPGTDKMAGAQKRDCHTGKRTVPQRSSARQRTPPSPLLPWLPPSHQSGRSSGALMLTAAVLMADSRRRGHLQRPPLRRLTLAGDIGLLGEQIAHPQYARVDGSGALDLERRLDGVAVQPEHVDQLDVLLVTGSNCFGRIALRRGISARR